MHNGSWIIENRLANGERKDKGKGEQTLLIGGKGTSEGATWNREQVEVKIGDAMIQYLMYKPSDHQITSIHAPRALRRSHPHATR